MPKTNAPKPKKIPWWKKLLAIIVPALIEAGTEELEEHLTGDTPDEHDPDFKP
jgi:hypothetical protein